MNHSPLCGYNFFFLLGNVLYFTIIVLNPMPHLICRTYLMLAHPNSWTNLLKFYFRKILMCSKYKQGIEVLRLFLFWKWDTHPNRFMKSASNYGWNNSNMVSPWQKNNFLDLQNVWYYEHMHAKNDGLNVKM